jgi:hypothetical protein
MRVFDLLILPALFGLSACGSAPPAPTAASLKVYAEPVTTSVYVDDRFVGSGRVLAIKPVIMRPGVRYLTFTAPGYFPHDLKLNLPSGTTSVSIKLRPVPP